MILTEAMLHGFTCVSFNCPYGPSDIINHNQNGILIDNGDINAFSKGINKLIKNEKLRKEMGQKSIIKALDFSPNKILKEWDQLFKSLL